MLLWVAVAAVVWHAALWHDVVASVASAAWPAAAARGAVVVTVAGVATVLTGGALAPKLVLQSAACRQTSPESGGGQA